RRRFCSGSGAGGDAGRTAATWTRVSSASALRRSRCVAPGTRTSRTSERGEGAWAFWIAPPTSGCSSATTAAISEAERDTARPPKTRRAARRQSSAGRPYAGSVYFYFFEARFRDDFLADFLADFFADFFAVLRAAMLPSWFRAKDRRQCIEDGKDVS